MTQQSPSAGTLRRRRRPRPAPPRRSLAAGRPAAFVRRQAALFAAVPLWLRAGIAVLACTALALSCVLVTRTYIAHEAERRRLEQEATDLASHPLYFKDLIVRYAAENGVDPALVSAVILCESSFDPQAESRLGARGLMQLMEPTAQWAAESLNEDEGYSFDLLYDPETNVRFGTWYLGYLSRRFDGDILKVVCGYHAGQGNVDAWLANPKYSPDGVTLQNVPEGGTSTYAQRVMNAYEIYRKYYFPPQPSAMA